MQNGKQDCTFEDQRVAGNVDEHDICSLQELLGILRVGKMAFLQSFYDESEGQHDCNRNVFTLGGCTMEEASWLRLEPHWKEVLRQFGVKIHRSSDCYSGHGDYKGWNDNKRHDYQQSLLAAIRRSWSGTSICSVFTGLVLRKDEFDGAVADYPSFPISIYEFSLWRMLAGSIEAIQNISGENTLGIFVEKGRDVRQHIRDRIDRMQTRAFRVAGFAFVDKKMYFPLQVADMMAHSALRSVAYKDHHVISELKAIGVATVIDVNEDTIRKILRGTISESSF